MARLNYFRFVKNFSLNNFSFRHVHIPLNAQIELTMRCNGRCVFCSIWQPSFQQELEPEMTTDQIKRIIDQLNQLDVQVVNFTGGEPTLRPDLSDLITYAAGKGMMPTIATNGFNLYNLLRAGKLADVEWIMVSLDWPDRENHDRYRGIPIFDRVIKGIRAARLLRKTVLISAVVTQENLTSMEAMVKLAYELGAMIELLPCENIIREQNSLHQVLDIDQYLPDIPAYAREVRRLTHIYPNIITDNFTASIIEAGGFGFQRVLRCHIAKAFIMIHYNGEMVLPCKLHPVLRLNVKTHSVYDLYYSYEAQRIMAMKDDFPFCKGCRFGCAIAASIPTRWSTLYEKYIKAFFNGNLF